MTQSYMSEKLLLLTGQVTSSAKSICVLENGDKIFSEIINKIRKSRIYILLEMFIFEDGHIASSIAEALIDKSKSGIACYIILDHYGSRKLSENLVSKMKNAGINILFYNPISLRRFLLAKSLTRRSHRKSLIIDGEIGFVGGIGVADEWHGNAQNSEEWRDLFF